MGCRLVTMQKVRFGVLYGENKAKIRKLGKFDGP